MPAPARDLKAEQLKKLKANEKTILESIATYEDTIHWADEAITASASDCPVHEQTRADATLKLAAERKKLEAVKADIAAV